MANIYSERELNVVRTMRAAGASYKAIALKVGRTPQSVYMKLRTAGETDTTATNGATATTEIEQLRTVMRSNLPTTLKYSIVELLLN